MKVSAFLFDLDGTLVDALPDLATALNRLRGELGLAPLEIPRIRGYIGDGAAMLLTRALPPGEFSPLRLERFLALYRRHLLDRSSAYLGIREFLELSRSTPMAVVTNKPLAHARELLRGLDLLWFFPVVIGGDSCPEKKPHPAPVLRALELLGVGPAGAVLIGDHHTDLKAGRAAGVKTCFCAWGYGRQEDEPCDYFAATPAELARLFPPEGR